MRFVTKRMRAQWGIRCTSIAGGCILGDMSPRRRTALRAVLVGFRLVIQWITFSAIQVCARKGQCERRALYYRQYYLMAVDDDFGIQLATPQYNMWRRRNAERNVR